MIHLLYCANQGVFEGVMLSLMSVAAKSSGVVHATILTMDLRTMNERYAPMDAKHVNLLDKIVKQWNPENQVELINATELFLKKMSLSPNLTTGYTPYTLLRLLAAELNLPDHVLYLDADTMLNGDIQELLSYDIRSYELGGVVDYLGKYFIAKDYLNAGVLNLNLKRIRETGLFERALQLCMTKKMVFPDQDAINDLVKEKLILPERFNEQHKWKPDTVIQHFSKTIYFWPVFKVINIKQWQIELVQEVLKIHAYDDIYEKYLKIREEVGQEMFGPRQIYEPFTIKQQFQINKNEVKSYLHQNGGIFRG